MTLLKVKMLELVYITCQDSKREKKEKINEFEIEANFI